MVFTGGQGEQFNHASGIVRDADNAPSDTDKIDLQKAPLFYATMSFP
jgi:hypothetical protein